MLNFTICFKIFFILKSLYDSLIINITNYCIKIMIYTYINFLLIEESKPKGLH